MPRPSAHRPKEVDIDALAEKLRKDGVNPDFVSYPCTVGLATKEAHKDCTGKVVKVPSGEYVRCECRTCDHPEIRRRK